jgi:hypothetical protein
MDSFASSAATGSSSGVKRRGRPRAVGTRQRSPPGGRPAPEAPYALGRRGRTRRIAPP